MRKNPSSVPQTLELFQGYVVPLHYSARSRETMAQIKNAAPRVSICLMRSFTVMVECCRTGLIKKKNTTARETPPKDWTFLQWYSVSNNTHTTREQRCSPSPSHSNRSINDEHRRASSRSTYDRADLENYECKEVRELDIRAPACMR
jgi:hypothetical protein